MHRKKIIMSAVKLQNIDIAAVIIHRKIFYNYPTKALQIHSCNTSNVTLLP
jgi:hypothetical protein